MSARDEYVVGSEPGEQLEAARMARGLSQRDLARASGLRRRRIADFERGTTEPSEHEWAALADGLAIPADDLVSTRQGLRVVTTGAGGELRGDAALNALLREYVSMVLELRGTETLPLPTLRHDDLTELASALGGTPEAIESKLVELLGTDEQNASTLRSVILPSAIT